MADYDSPWKEALDHYFQPFMNLCFPDLALEVEFRNRLEQIEQENRMPYITSIERLAIEKGREEGILAGKIQML